MTEPVLELREVHKTYFVGFFRKRVDAVRGVSLRVEPGQIFGFLGPNGAGKTSSIKVLTGLIRATRGEALLFGRQVHDLEAARRVGYMPENPYVYGYLTPLEFLDLCGRLMGMPGPERRRRTGDMIERVGLAHAADRAIHRFSKGMMQRIGLAQALLHDPELLILDEPMSGLDPIGRKEVRDILLEQRKKGKTLFFSSHILSDVEMLCDRVAIVHKGKVVAAGALSELLRPEVRLVEIELANVAAELRTELDGIASETHAVGANLVVTVEGEALVPDVLQRSLGAGATVVAVTPRRETLEDIFLRRAV